MIRSSVRSAGLAVLLTMNGCGDLVSSGTGAGTPGLNVAEAALQGGSGQIALQVSDGVLRSTPGNVRAMEIKGDALALLGAYDQATVIYQTLLAKDPNSIRATIGMGRITLSKQPAVAEALFQQALKREPKDMTALNNLGIARDLQGHHAEAQTAYRQALAINPDLDSAQANLALSMAMSGQGAAAVQLLKAKATEPGVPAKVKHDYAVVLAMAGNRSEAERILSQDLPPDDVRQMLDSATGTDTRTARDGSQEPSGAAVASRDWDNVPPDVVQVPEQPSRPVASGRAAQVAAPPTIAGPTAAAAMAATMAAPAPMVVRPQPISGVDADAPLTQPVNPVAAAVTHQQSLAQPIQSAAAFASSSVRAPSEHAFTTEATPDQAVVVPAVVAMPSTDAVQRIAATTQSMADAERIALPEAPPPPPVLRPVPLPPAYQPLKTSARVEPTAPPAAPAATRPEAAQREDVGAEGARADVVRFETVAVTQPAAQTTSSAYVATPTVSVPARVVPETPPKIDPRAAVTTASDDTATAPTQIARGDETSTMVQFAATASEESARSFWQTLVQRFPEVLGRREPVVIRFEHDGTVFWRVRAEGFPSLSEAQTLCARMHADGQPCFVPRS